jgi:beta-lactamase regulating signal transducer with metallopeptidase domain
VSFEIGFSEIFMRHTTAKKSRDAYSYSVLDALLLASNERLVSWEYECMEGRLKERV